MKKRKLELAVISDVHLGSIACHADELLGYLSSIKPNKLVLNGDIIDAVELTKGYFPPAHMKVIKKIIGMASQGTKVYYITGSRDKSMYRFNGISMGNLHVVDKLILKFNEKKAWFFHGDIFENSFKKITWLSKLGIKNPNHLVKLNTIFKWLVFKKKKHTPSHQPKSQPNQCSAYKDSFKNYVTEMAIENGYDYAICGHIHEPKKEVHQTKRGNCTYLNSGDWVTNLTTLEYSFKRWKIYKYNSDKLLPFYVDDEIKDIDMHDIICKIRIEKEQEKKKEGGLSVDDSIL